MNLRQIYKKPSQEAVLKEDDAARKTFVKQRDHSSESNDILVDYLDYQADLLVI